MMFSNPPSHHTLSSYEMFKGSAVVLELDISGVTLESSAPPICCTCDGHCPFLRTAATSVTFSVATCCCMYVLLLSTGYVSARYLVTAYVATG